jgi:exopolysaccharide biosynthesis polyprenyl glycosylphosphotransferase
MLFRTKNLAATLFRYSIPWANPEIQTEPPTKSGTLLLPRERKRVTIPEPSPKKRHHSREACQLVLTVLVILGDYALIASGFVLTTLLLRSDLLPPLISGLRPPPFGSTYHLLLPAAVFVLLGLRGKALYSYRNLLIPSRIWHTLFGSMFVYCSALIGISVVVHTNPLLTWKFCVFAAAIICTITCSWRLAISRVIRLDVFASRLRNRLVVIGGGTQALRIQKSLGGEYSDMEFIGWVEAIKPNHVAELEEFRLGPLHELRNILRTNEINIAVLVESESLQREGVVAVTQTCENEHVQFNMVPHFFEVLVSAVRPESIGEMQLLGVQCLPLTGLRNRVMKRTVDIVGAVVGLAISIPLMTVFGAIVFFESPGPIFYRQIRQGKNGRLFYIIKLRSMRLNAEADGKAQWAKCDDDRRLRVGTFMRKWNIDEVPQFWNVLRGQMSLVGPRPERPELIARFESTVPHYQARHMYQPGMTGWAQIKGWRGDTCLEQRIRHDIWYLENWNIWLDFRIMLQTFVHQKNAY